jgi:malto-oligosyltrehalose synthase/4-alpha-glucanotransferase
MFDPVATYRLQFHKDFRFEDFERVIPYLQQLGVSTIYASPIFEATPGSTHGYDSVNPHRINPEIGTEEQLRNISSQLKENRINWLQDIVPNHMAFHPNNPWLMDVMEKGRESQYASFFDIGWEGPVDEGKLMVPFLVGSLEEVVEKGELKLSMENERPVFKYYDSSYPLNSLSVSTLEQLPGTGHNLYHAIEQANGDRNMLLHLARIQHYRLCHWQETDSQINFRRFFTINGLISLNIQNEDVFAKYHEQVETFVTEGIFNGLRIDHIDGLYDPTAYLEKLRELAGKETYIIVEKILEPGEGLPKYWPIQGNTGYDFLSLVNNLFTNKQAEEKFTNFYHQLIGKDISIHEQLREKKAYILHNHMKGELENLYQLLKNSQLADIDSVSPKIMKEAIGEFLIQCPVYRYYGNSLPLDPEERTAVSDILLRIEATNPQLAYGLAVLRNVWLEKAEEGDQAYNERASHFYKRCMQFSGPLMAKGVEDTLMYTYNRFIGHNDVGDSPEAFGISKEDFHLAMLDRQKSWPLTINATSTHDTKRGEDVRARLNVLTDLPDEWEKAVKEWQAINAQYKTNSFPDANDEYFIYQTMVGAYPMPGTEDHFTSRTEAYLEKAMREAKLHSNWTTPNEEYEQATKQFIKSILSEQSSFLESFKNFQEQITDAGISNSLAQVVLKFTCPGVPDVYQGAELWDLSLVDPDNRRAIDYEKRRAFLESFSHTEDEQLLSTLWEQRANAQVKLWLTHKLLTERRQHPELFSKGEYIPLKVEGRYADNLIAFARRIKHTWYLVAVPLHIAQLSKEQKKDVTQIDWRNTRVILRPETPTEWQHLLTPAKGKVQKEILIKDIFKELPLALLKMEHAPNERGAGLLLAVSSLPSPFGVGDIGPEARNFARFLSRSKQKYWQILPLNPTEMGAGHSPYSSYSSMGGNPLLISPELLVEEGLLDKELLEQYRLDSGDSADYAEAEELKEELFNIAYRNFCKDKFRLMRKEFDRFCEKEAYWLNDMSLYVVLKQHHGGKPWYEWDQQYKLRDQHALDQFSVDKQQEIRKVKWLQFTFLKQWKGLREYVNNLGIDLFGDMPFYVSYDSVDVWSHPDIFCLDKNGKMTGVAGVPPDYFSEDGQLWGMPTFNWNALKEQGYKWWITRLRKNLELFDLLRIDHFRAFQEYWQVPAGESTARTGEWIPGPQTEFFEAVEKELGKLPFVAEDLGDRMEAVYELRGKLGLPGMKVLQFAWGENMAWSVDVPHNHEKNSIVYTGTHDNNTTIGWYREETNKADHERMHRYIGVKVRQKNIDQVLSRLAYSSVAKLTMLPMQDVLGLDASSRMNTPGRAEGNWLWRLKPGQLTPEIEAMLREWVEVFNRT